MTASTYMSDVDAGDRFEYVIRLADDSLILSHRIAEWASWAPQIEEDMALVNIALDLLGQARNLLSYAGALEGEGNTEDDLAYLREEHEFRNVLLVEYPTRHEYGELIAIIFYFSAYYLPLLEGLTQSRDRQLAEIAAKAVKEVRYHLEHSASWVIRLGDGTEESHRRLQTAVDRHWPLVGDLFEIDDVTRRLMSVGIAPNPDAVKERFDRTVDEVFAEATITKPARGFRQGTGRRGLHTEPLGFLLAEMQYIHRLHPGVKW